MARLKKIGVVCPEYRSRFQIYRSDWFDKRATRNRWLARPKKSPNKPQTPSFNQYNKWSFISSKKSATNLLVYVLWQLNKWEAAGLQTLTLAQYTAKVIWSACPWSTVPFNGVWPGSLWLSHCAGVFVMSEKCLSSAWKNVQTQSLLCFKGFLCSIFKHPCITSKLPVTLEYLLYTDQAMIDGLCLRTLMFLVLEVLQILESIFLHVAHPCYVLLVKSILLYII